MQTETTHRAKPVQQAERRAAAAERQIEKERAAGALDRETIRRLTADLADMREDRDRWRAQAEKLTAPLERFGVPDIAPPPALPTASANPSGTILFGIPAIAAYLGITERQARHLSDKKSIPTFKMPGSAIICAREETLSGMVVEQEAAARKAPPAAPAKGGR